jgi:molecular chaperone DnaK
MVALPPDASVRLRLKCPDAEDFVERFAPNVTRGGIFLPTREARELGATIRFEIALGDGAVVFAGEGGVSWAKPQGLGVKFTTRDPASDPMLERLLSRKEAAAAAPESPAAAPASATPVPLPPAPAPPPLPAPSLAPASAPAIEPLAPATEPSAPATESSAPATEISAPSIVERARRPLLRPLLVCAAVFVSVAVVWMSI